MGDTRKILKVLAIIIAIVVVIILAVIACQLLGIEGAVASIVGKLPGTISKPLCAMINGNVIYLAAAALILGSIAFWISPEGAREVFDGLADGAKAVVQEIVNVIEHVAEGAALGLLSSPLLLVAAVGVGLYMYNKNSNNNNTNNVNTQEGSVSSSSI